MAREGMEMIAKRYVEEVDRITEEHERNVRRIVRRAWLMYAAIAIVGGAFGIALVYWLRS